MLAGRPELAQDRRAQLSLPLARTTTQAIQSRFLSLFPFPVSSPYRTYVQTYFTRFTKQCTVEPNPQKRIIQETGTPQFDSILYISKRRFQSDSIIVQILKMLSQHGNIAGHSISASTHQTRIRPPVRPLQPRSTRVRHLSHPLILRLRGLRHSSGTGSGSCN
ncbi:hypothetical protein BCR34DRAFT_132267 [Clohesyomyces aquaticus]|uniref:Uncharacterized protein n=1 Tax=Clohesyomyces aquaticus TaxID=1231657 RepID=A0A1Y2AAK7_9PLEO|nr:hypothetical protein BCR34DRAFT_132267 [Clohesyomyces aquaticus]